jgi:hypothetical protein
LKVLSNDLKRLVALLAFACARIACTSRNQTCGRSYKTIPPVVACWALGCCPWVAGPQHASSFPMMKMIDGTHLNLLFDVVITTGHHIDVLPAPWLLLEQKFNNEKLHGAMEVCLTQAILLDWYILRISWFQEVLVHDLLPGSLYWP